MLLNFKEYFSDLKFDEPSHTYKVGSQSKKPVSTWIHDFVEEVDWEQKAEGVALKEGITPEEVLRKWEIHKNEAASKGTRVHLFAEGDMLNPELGEEFAVIKFWEELDINRYKLVHKELRMYHFNHELAGTMDLLLYDMLECKYIIADYKTNENLFKCFKYKRLLPPFDYLEDHPFNHYQIQFSFYQLLLEQVGVHVAERWLIWLKPDASYQLFKTEDLTEELKNYLQC